VELIGGMYGQPMRAGSQDLHDMERWMQTVRRVCSHAEWTRMVAGASAGLQAWYRNTNTQRVIAEMAHALDGVSGAVSCHTLHDLMGASSAAMLVPTPHFEPVLAAERYMPGVSAAPAPRTSRAASLVSGGGPQRGCCASLHGWNHDLTCQYAGRPAHQRTSTRATKPTIFCVRDDEERVGFCDAHNDEVDDCPEVPGE
jgi:hypothetical protein